VRTRRSSLEATYELGHAQAAAAEEERQGDGEAQHVDDVRLYAVLIVMRRRRRGRRRRVVIWRSGFRAAWDNVALAR